MRNAHFSTDSALEGAGTRLGSRDRARSAPSPGTRITDGHSATRHPRRRRGGSRSPQTSAAGLGAGRSQGRARSRRAGRGTPTSPHSPARQPQPPRLRPTPPRPRFPLRAAGPRRHPPRPGGGRGFAPPPTKRGPAPPPPTAAPRPRGDAQLPSGFHSGCEQALRPGAGRVLDAGWRARGRAAAAVPSDSKTPSDRARPRARPAARPAAIFSSRPAAGARTGRRAPGELGRDGGREPRGGEVGPG